MSSKIEWTEETWNPVVGCSKVSDGCKHCYAMTMANRLAHIHHSTDLYMDTVTVTAGGRPNWTGVVKVSEGAMDKPMRFKKPTMFFVNSMSDLFHDGVSFETVDRVFDVMNSCEQHVFQILTKRPKRMLEYFNWKGNGHGVYFDRWPLENVWLGVSVENQKCAEERIPLLMHTPAAVRFLSCEPLLGAIDFSKVKIPVPPTTMLAVNLDWVIVGGESGRESRPMHPDWVRGIRDQCKVAGVPFFFKQWGDWVALPANAHLVNKDIIITNGLKVAAVGKGGELIKEGTELVPIDETTVYMRRVGKGKAPKGLDGVVHRGMPRVYNDKM